MGRGSGVKVRLGKSRSAWYGGDFWVFWVHIGVVWLAGCLSFFRRGFLSTSAGKLSCTSLGSARLSAGNEPCREVRDWAIQWSLSWTSPEMKASTEVADRNLGFFVCKFCWLMRFWLIYEVLGVWVDRLLFDFVWMISEFLELIQWSFSWTLPKMKAPAEVVDGRLEES